MEYHPVFTPLWSADHLPLMGGDQQDARASQNQRPSMWARYSSDLISPLEGEMPGRAEGGRPLAAASIHEASP
jgi:hypothetical protein